MVAWLRSARLGCWANSWLSGFTSLEEADTAIRDGDAAHHIVGLPGSESAVPLLLGLGSLRGMGARACSLALPVPGDPLGLAGPRAFNDAAFEAGEAVIIEGSGLGLVPLVVGAGVQWQAYDAKPAPPLGVSETATELTRELHAATDVLRDLDNAEWRPELAAALAGSGGRGQRIAPGYSDRADQLAHRAALCVAVQESVDDDTAGFDGDARRKVLRSLGSAARRALIAACAPPRPGRQ